MSIMDTFFISSTNLPIIPQIKYLTPPTGSYHAVLFVPAARRRTSGRGLIGNNIIVMDHLKHSNLSPDNNGKPPTRKTNLLGK